MLGKVKWFDDQKGFGFITPDDGSEEVFAHYTEIKIKARGRRSLQPGQMVSFGIELTARGGKAVAITPAI